jgi:hypothetical protein
MPFKTPDFYISYSLQANVNRDNVSLALVPIATQTWCFIRCSRFSSIIFPRTRTSSSAAWERTNHLVCNSYKRKLEHVQTCLNTWACLTQEPSDTLRPFRELNCRTWYFLAIFLMITCVAGVLAKIRNDYFQKYKLWTLPLGPIYSVWAYSTRTFGKISEQKYRFCNLVVRVLGYRCRGPGFDSGALQKK